MKAIVNDRYGSPERVSLQDVDEPVLDDDAVLVRVRAASVNPYDWHYIRGQPYVVRLAVGLRRPRTRVLGVDMAGQVQAVGKNVTHLRPGDEVFGWAAGALAEYVRADESTCVAKPALLTFEQAAAIPIAGCTALQAVRDHGRVHAGQHVLINGASGGVGTFAVQVARALGAEVTGVCGAKNVDLVRSIGSHQVVDYTVEDFTRSGRRHDLIVDLIGNHSLSSLRRALTPSGTLVLAGGGRGRWLGPLVRPVTALVLSPFTGQRLVPFLARRRTADLAFLKELIECGRMTPIIDRTCPLAESSQAIRYVEAGHARGKVIIQV